MSASDRLTALRYWRAIYSRGAPALPRVSIFHAAFACVAIDDEIQAVTP